jgi:hypothetical protein
MIIGFVYEGTKNAVVDDYTGTSCNTSGTCDDPIDLRNPMTWFIVYLSIVGAGIVFSWGIKPLMNKSNNQKRRNYNVKESR